MPPLIALASRPLTLGVIQAPSQLILEADETRHWWQHILVHLTMLHAIVPSAWLPSSQFAFLPPAWSISLEFQLYLVAPLLVWWLSRSGLRGMFVVLIPSALCVVPQVYSKIAHIWQGGGGFLPEKFFFFLLGSLIYLFTTKGPKTTTLYRYPLWAVARRDQLFNLPDSLPCPGTGHQVYPAGLVTDRKGGRHL